MVKKCVVVSCFYKKYVIQTKDLKKIIGREKRSKPTIPTF